MRKLLLIILLITTTSCGGGGGYLLRKEVPINTIDIHKYRVPYREDFLTIKYLLFWNSKDTNRLETFRDVLNSEFTAKNSHKYELAVPFTWNNRKYKIACSQEGGPFHGAFAILDLDNNLIKHIKTPRYTTGTDVLPIKDLNGNDYLIALVKHQSTSFSSSLFIFDKDFNMVYQEFLGKVEWIAADNDYNNIFYINSLPDKKKMWAYTVGDASS